MMKSAFRSSNDNMSNSPSKKHDYIVHQHMLAHYRRLYSVKSGVDTSTPAHFKPRYKPKPRPSLPIADVSSHPQLTNKDLKFLQSLAGEVTWNRSGSRHSVRSCGQRNSAERSKENVKISTLGQDRSHNCLHNEHKSIDYNKQSMAALAVKCSPKRRKDLNFKKCALAYGASSKLREMSVYHPPRRRIGTGITNKYCGQCTSKLNKGSCVNASGDIAPTSTLFANEISSVIEEQKEELLYLKFIQDITQDILSNEVYSNEGLMQIFKNHLNLNRDKLDRNKMIKEVQKLGVRIGLPHYNYLSSVESNKHAVGEMGGDIGDYEYYEDYHPEMKNVSSLTFNHKSNYRDDFNENLSGSTSDRVEEIRLTKQGEIFQKGKESQVLGFLEEMGFDSNIAEEICVCMTDRDFSKFQFTSNGSKTNTGFHRDFVSARKIDDCLCKKEHSSKDTTDLYRFCDASFDFRDENKNQTSILYDQEETIEMERILESIHGSNITRDSIGNTQAFSSTARRKSRETIKESTFAADLHEECVREKESQKSLSEQKSKTDSASPMGSDYSSMKDHDDSTSDGYSEEQDESQESASEEIPEDLSESSVSSGVSQITEKLKEFSIDLGTVLHSRPNERKKLSAEGNTHSLRELILQ